MSGFIVPERKRVVNVFFKTILDRLRPGKGGAVRAAFPSPIAFREAPSVSLSLPDEATLWCYGRVGEYRPDRMVFLSEGYTIVLEGEGLAVKAMSESEIWIRGKILSLSFGEAGK